MRPLLTSLLVAAAACAAQADVVHLRDGRTLEGSVIRGKDHLIVRRKLGSVHVQLSDVVRVEETTDRWDELERLRSELADGDAEERYRFGAWCRDHDFKEEAQRAFLSVLRLDLDHPGARAALGYVLHDGVWLTLADKKRLEGLVEFEGAWVTPQEQQRLAAAKQEQIREAREARVAAREAERQARRDAQEAEREGKLEARRERAQELARARAWARVTSTPWRNWGGGTSSTSVLYPYGWGGTCTSYRPYQGDRRLYGQRGYPLTFGSDRRPYNQRGYSYRSYGVQLNGSYTGGNWGVTWRVGY